MEIKKTLNVFGMIALTTVSIITNKLNAQTNMENNKKVVLITGAASGIGKATAIKFAENGFEVYATDKNTILLEDLTKYNCKTIYLDVTNEKSIVDAVQKINSQSNGVDILINNAGFGQNGVIEELPIDAIRKQFEVNVFGLLRVTQEVLPTLRNKKKGRIINIGSVGGEFTTPGASAYHASKYALESFNDGLRGELRQFGIDVVLIKPGGVYTNFVNASNKLYPSPIKDSPYLDFREKFQTMTNKLFDPKSNSFGILTPEKVASVIYKSATVRNPRTRYRIGALAKITPRLRRLFGDNGWDKFMLKQIGVSKEKPKND
jgi:short-subunit dehydrogenase